ncbi:hypothetical protein A9Q87_00040 [Flavobacteriales bacterium 34_180_T64]|nr:hypothetical protein A9Q87_00040 [Flavobacteriales bacterium 34_180_T64]
MAQDIRKLFENEQKVSNQKMPDQHEARFLSKLEKAMPVTSIKKRFSIMQLAASVVILIGLSFGASKYFETPEIEPVKGEEVAANIKTLGDISPDFKKVEDYYLANINLELSKVKLTSENKELFDSYVQRLEELNKEYDRLSVELTESGPNELTVSALIDNLKFRLNLLYRLKEQLKDLNDSDSNQEIL